VTDRRPHAEASLEARPEARPDGRSARTRGAVRRRRPGVAAEPVR
jgi:hypothetical protein